MEGAKGAEATELSSENPIIFVRMEFFPFFVTYGNVRQHRRLS
jgi:hypothetical protein